MKSAQHPDTTAAKKQAASASKPMYPEQHQKLQEMGFDTKSIQEALASTNGDLQAATAVLLGETSMPTPAPQPVKPVAPMKVVGKQASAPVKPVKIDYKEIHNKFMATYKVAKCKEKANHDKRLCFHYHAKGDRRRNPFEIQYTCSECPNSTETNVCENGDGCLKAHNMLERMFHPDLFKISMCQRGPNGSHCERGNLCAFAHSDEDHRVPMAHSAAKAAAAAAAALAVVTTAPVVTAPAAPVNADQIVASKSLTDSRMLDSIQDKLVKLIQNQGTEGIISSELPKRYFDAYAERLDLADEAGEKFRIKDLLLSHSNISMTMHKGVQPKYVYEDTSAKSSAKPAPGSGKSASTVVGVSYSAMATQNVKPSATKPPGPLNYAAAIAPGTAAATPVGPAATEVTEIKADKETAKALPAVAGSVGATQPSEVSQWPSVSLLDGTAAGSPTNPGSPFLPVGTRRRGPDSGPVDRADASTPPVAGAHFAAQAQQQSPGQVSTSSNRLSLADVASTQPHTTASSSPGGPFSNTTSPGKVAASAAVAEYHERLVQAHASCEKLAHQVQLLQGELGKRNAESEVQTMQMKGMMTQLNESADNQNKANSAKDAAITEVYRVRHELDELRNHQAVGVNGDAQKLHREVLMKETIIAQLRQERAADLKQFCLNLSQIESALVDMQRKEAIIINEIPLHDTINESSRARDELTKYVTMLKQQMTNRILNETAAANANSGAGMSKSVANGLTGAGALSSLLGVGVGAQPQKLADPADVFGSPLRAAFAPQAASFLPGVGFLSKPHDSSLLLGQPSSLLGDDLSLMMQDTGDAYSLLLGNAAAVPLQSNVVAGSRVLGGLGAGSSVLSTGLPASTGGAMVCALPGCGAEGTFVCSACNRSGYCGAQHQRYSALVWLKVMVSFNSQRFCYLA
jgi:hypothetical protein